jgi:uncharacterized membrane protein YraQ (UPF0718 family)
LKRWAWFGLALVLLAGMLTSPRVAGETAWFVAENLLLLSPLLALAVVLSAYLRASGLDQQIALVFRGRRLAVIVAASAFGALTPICGLGVLPLIAGLLASGVPLAPIMAFWLSSPITDPSMLIVTAGMLGTPFAVAKTVGAFAIGLLGGLATEALTSRGVFQAPLKPAAGELAPGCGPAGRGPDGCGVRGVDCRFWRDPGRRHQFLSEVRASGLLVAKWLSFAFALESLLRRVLPPELIAGLVGGESAWAIPLAVLVGTPIYLDGYASLPLVRGLVELGMAPGAALAFMIAGGITSAYASVAVYAVVRLPVFLWYLALAVIGALLAGYGYAAALAL